MIIGWKMNFKLEIEVYLNLGLTSAQNDYDTITNCNKVEPDKILKHIQQDLVGHC